MLIDPLGLPSELEQLAAERELVIVLTSPWHERDAEDLVERFGAPVYAPAPDTREDLLEKFDFEAPEGWTSSDLAWLMSAKAIKARVYAAGDRLDVGIEAFRGWCRNDLVLWIESRGAVIAGDTLADFGRGIEINVRWLSGNVTREQVAEGLRPLLELPVEHLLATHGGPTDKAALERALT
jgi:glyoxylase-like metal-dependent hydrolase (beta-lactamase superfamily II)